jgi:hypothetical protein
MRKRAAIFFMAGAILILFGASCGATEREAVTPPSPSPSAPPPKAYPSPSAPEWLAAGATNRVADITGAPNAFIGKTVTVVAEIDDVYGPRAFTLDGEGPAPAKGARKGLLTLVPKVGGFPGVDAQWKDDKARVTGVVHRMVVKDVEREIGWELPANLKSKFAGGPVLIARSIERLVK